MGFALNNNVKATFGGIVNRGSLEFPNYAIQYAHYTGGEPHRNMPAVPAPGGYGIVTLVNSLIEPTKFEIIRYTSNVLRTPSFFIEDSYTGVSAPCWELRNITRGFEGTEVVDWSAEPEVHILQCATAACFDDTNATTFGGLDPTGYFRYEAPYLPPDCPVYGGHTLWHSGSDGAGSGLDADMLDGYQASQLAVLAENEVVTGAWKFTHPMVATAEYDNGNSDSAELINWNTNGRYQRSLINQSTTIAFTAPAGPCELQLKVVTHPTTGATNTIAWPASVKWRGGVAPNHRTGNNKTHLFRFYFDGTNYFGSADMDFS